MEEVSAKARRTSRCKRGGKQKQSAGIHTECAGHAVAHSTSAYSDWSKTRASTDWNTDTGASSHMTPHRHWFRSYSPHVVPIRLADNSIIYSAGIGSVEFQPVVKGSNMRPVVFHDVLHVPAIRSNLLSLFHLTSKKAYTISIVDQTVSFHHSGCLCFTASITDRNIGYLDGHARSFGTHEAKRASTLPLDLNLWHRRCSHLNYDDVKRMQRNDLVKGMTMESSTPPDPICEPCIAGKQHRHNIPQTATRRTKPLALVHTDLKGPMPVATPEGYRYWMTFICDSKRYWAVAFLKQKSEAFTAFKQYKAYAEKVLGVRIIMTRDDKGGEYMGREFEKFCADEGISRQHTEPNEPHQNGVAERANRDIANGATTLLVEARLPPSFWRLAVMAYVHTRNRTPTSALNGEIPYMEWKHKKPDVSYFRVFGCLAYVLIRKEKRKALQPHTKKCIFVGYPGGTKAWLFWDPASRQFITSSHAVFDERCFPGNSAKTINLLTSSVNDSKSPENDPAVVVHHGGDSDKGDDDDTPPLDLPVPPVPDQHPLQPPHRPQAPHTPSPPPPQQRRTLPARSSRPQRNLNFDQLQRENAPGPSQRHVTPPPPQVREDSPDPLLMSPPIHSAPEHVPRNSAPSSSPDALRLLPTLDFHTPRRPTPILNSDTEDDEDEDYEEEANLVQAGLEFIQTQYLTWEDAVEYASQAVALKAATHFGEPNSFREAMQRPEPERGEWLKAALDEIQALIDNGTFELVPLPPGRKAVGSRWVFRIKHNADGSVDRYKGRLVAQGFSQRPGFDYNETFAPTPTWAALRAVIAIAALEDLELESVDISSAFLNGKLEEEVYMRQPEGFERNGSGWVWRLLKSLYGLKQSPRVWHQKLNSVLESMGFTRILCEHSIWIYHRGDVRVIIPVFIDDMTFASKSKSEIQKVKDELSTHFKLHDLGPASWLLGVKIERDRRNRTLHLSQRQYILDLLQRFDLTDINPVGTPLDPSIRLSTSMAPQTPEEIAEMEGVPYINAVGALNYLAIATRPDISYTVGVLARFTNNPGMQHWKAVKHLFRYLKGTLDYKLTYSPSPSTELFTTFSDADHAGNPDNGRSTSGYLVKVGTGAISWRSRLQTLVALSTTEAEFIAAVSAGQEILFLRNLFKAFGYKIDEPSTLFIDNNSAISVAKNPEHHGRMKHLDLRFYWLRDEVEKKKIQVKHVDTNNMAADILTKALGRVKVGEMVKMLGLTK
jgi:hypothetical protein